MRELTDLRHALTKNKLGVVGAREGQTPSQLSTLNSQHSAVVQGLGGMGKTELALAYAHAFAWDYPGGRWQIPCEHVSDLRVALLHLANANALNFEFTEDEKKNVALAFERVLRELNRRERCLLILDNVSDPNLLQPEYLDRLPRDGRVDLIATTRLAPRAIPGAANEQSFIAVDELPEEDALALMRSHQSQVHFASQQEDDEARAIVRLLRGFTLAVETAAIYLGRDTAPDACRRFRERLSPDLLRESETAATDPAVAVRHRVRSLEETLAFTLQTLSPEALHLLEIASLLPADQIALSWLKAVGREKFPEFIESNSAFRQAEELLLGLRLFQSAGAVDNDGRLLVVRMHRLVQELVAKRENFAQKTLLEKLTGHAETRSGFLHEGWVQSKYRWELDPLVACASMWMAKENETGIFLAGNLSVPLLQLARWDEAERLLRQAVKQGQEIYTPTHPKLIGCVSNLASLLQATGKLVEAESLHRRTLTMQEQSLGLKHPSLASTLSNLSLLLKDTNRLSEAELLVRRALEIDESTFGKNHHKVAMRLNNLAQVIQCTDRVGETEALLRRTVSILDHAQDEDHPNLAQALNNLALLLMDTNRLEEAESLMRCALAINQRTLGEQHPYTARSLNDLASLFVSTNRLTDAEPLMRRALAIDEQSFGPEHSTVARDLNNLANILYATDRTTDAEPLLRRSLQIHLRLNQVSRLSHRDADAVIDQYGALLRLMGLSESQMLAKLNEVGAEFGKRFEQKLG